MRQVVLDTEGQPLWLGRASRLFDEVIIGVLINQSKSGLFTIEERIAMLDLVSNGRVDVGSGESSSEAELGGFRIQYGEKRDAWPSASATSAL